MALLSIDPEFRDLCPPLSTDERERLRSLILEKGCDPIKVWKTPDENGAHPIVDGHNRYDICTNEGLTFDVQFLHFPDRQAVKHWILCNQLGRRNLTDQQRAIARGKLFEAEKLGHGGDRKSKCHNDTLIDKAQEIATRESVSRSTVIRDGKFAAATEAVAAKAPELRRPIERGLIPRSDVPALARAPQAKLEELAQLEGIQQREAARKLARDVPTNGQQKHDPRLKQGILDQLGKALRMIDDLNRQDENAIKHRAAIAQVKMAMSTLRDWNRDDEEAA